MKQDERVIRIMVKVALKEEVKLKKTVLISLPLLIFLTFSIFLTYPSVSSAFVEDLDHDLVVPVVSILNLSDWQQIYLGASDFWGQVKKIELFRFVSALIATTLIIKRDNSLTFLRRFRGILRYKNFAKGETFGTKLRNI